MNKWQAIFLTCILFAHSARAENSELKASVEISIDPQETIWSGQQITLNLNLRTTGFSFSEVYFNLPEISGAFLMQIDTTTVKSTIQIDSQSWQVISYPLALYPQTAGLLEIPPISVRFKTSSGFGTEKKSFNFETKNLQLEITSPPGIKPGELLITTASFELDYNWQPESGTARTGDAITLTVKRRAEDISAMLLPPIPVFHAPGLAAYPQTPEVKDKSNRGDLVGERTDKIIWLVEKPGVYAIPDLNFQWWDPNKRELKQQVIPGIKLDIAAVSTDTPKLDNQQQIKGKTVWLLGTMLVLLGLIAYWLKFGFKAPWLTNENRADTEKSAYQRLQQACKDNSPEQAHLALYSWIEFIQQQHFADTRISGLVDFAEALDEPVLAEQLNYLQKNIISEDSNWQGAELSRALKACRHRLRQEKIVQSNNYLSALNP